MQEEFSEVIKDNGESLISVSVIFRNRRDAPIRGTKKSIVEDN